MSEMMNAAIQAIGACPKCGTEMAIGRYGLYCPNKCGFRIGKVFGADLSDDQKIALLNGEEVLVEGIISKRTGKPYSVYVKANGLREYQYTRRDGTEATGWDFELERRFPNSEK